MAYGLAMTWWSVACASVFDWAIDRAGRRGQCHTPYMEIWSVIL